MKKQSFYIRFLAIELGAFLIALTTLLVLTALPLPSPGPLPPAPIQNGHLYEEQSKPEIFLAKGGKKLWIPSMTVLTNLGFSTADVSIVPDGSLSSIPSLPNLAGPVFDALNTATDDKVKPSDVFFGPFKSPEPPPVFGGLDTQKDSNSVVVRDFYVAGWLLPDGNGRGPFAHCAWPGTNNPLCIEDFLYELQVDPDFLLEMYGPDGLLRIPDTVVLHGNPSANAKVLPFTNVDAGGAVSPNSLALFNGGDLKLHVELNSWHAKSTGYVFYRNWIGRGPAPHGWVRWDGDNRPWGQDALQDQRAAQAQNWWPFYPYDPEGRGPLQVGQYVIMRGTIWQDEGHDADSNGNSDMDKVGLNGQGAWLEIHPPDMIIRSRPLNCNDAIGNCQLKRAFVVTALNDANQQVNDQVIDIGLPSKPAATKPGETFRIRYQEYLDLRFSTPSQITNKTVEAFPDRLQLHLRIENNASRRAMFKATYLTSWEPNPDAVTAPAKITASPGALDFGRQPIDVASTMQTVTVANTGATPANLAISTSDPFWENHTCTSTLPPSASCTVRVSFIPSGPGYQSRILQLGSGLPVVGLSGIGFDPPRSGTITTSDTADRIGWTYEPEFGAFDTVTLQICQAPALTWHKGLVLRNGSLTLLDLSIQNSTHCSSGSVPLGSIQGQFGLELWKAKSLGISSRVRSGTISEFMPLRSRGRLTLTWTQD
jgi:hypothetical protein